jgi:hypothetical protein
MTTKSQPAAVVETITPLDMEAHEADKARRAAERDKKKPELDRCLDPQYAAEKEAQKPLYLWTVSGDVPTRDEAGAIIYRPHKVEVVAQESPTGPKDGNAWAMFCDKIHTLASRGSVKNLEIVRGKKIDPAAAMAARLTQPFRPDM